MTARRDAKLRPPGPRGLRASGRAALALLTEPTRPLDELAARYGRTFEVALGPLRLVIVGDPEHVREVLATDLDAFRWARVMCNLGFVVGASSMLVSDGEAHRRRRSLVQPGFARRRLDSWVPVVVAETDRLLAETVGAASGAVEVDLYALTRVLVRRIVVRVLFGTALGSRADEIGELLEPAMSYGSQPALRQLPHPFPRTKRASARAARRSVDRLLDEEIARCRAHPDPDANDLLRALVGADDGLSDAEIRDQIVTLIAAGYDTSTAGVAWLLVRALETPGVWAGLRNEADSWLDSEAQRVDSAALSQLDWSAAVVGETLRLHPPGVFAPREATRVLAVGPYLLARGSLVLWSPYLMGRDPTAWENPLEFQPERFAGRSLADARSDPGWAPFGRGPRSCIGFALAQMEMTLIPSRLAQRLDVELVTPGVPAPAGMVVSRPSGGLPVRLRNRVGPDRAVVPARDGETAAPQ
jgi:cytochrome P450